MNSTLWIMIGAITASVAFGIFMTWMEQPWNVQPTSEFRTKVTWLGHTLLQQKFTGRMCAAEWGPYDVYLWKTVQALP